MKEFEITRNEEDLRLDNYLIRLLPGAGKSFLYKMLRKKNITLNGKKAEGTEHVRTGDIIRIFFSDETFLKFHSEALTQPASQHAGAQRKNGFGGNSSNQNSSVEASTFPTISIIYEDQDILIADKPAGVLSQKAKPQDYSLNEWFVDYTSAGCSGGQTDADFDGMLQFTPSVANRLDRNTSGLILCGKTLLGSRYLTRVLRDRTAHKYYLAIVHGHVTKASHISGFLSKNQRTNQVIVTNKPENTDADAIETSYEPLLYQKELDMTLLRVLLITGKTHQIRAHLASIGHGIIGDPKYGSMDRNHDAKKQFGVNRQLLHAYQITFPVAAETSAALHVEGRTFYAAVPEDFYRRIPWQPGIQEVLEALHLKS